MTEEPRRNGEGAPRALEAVRPTCIKTMQLDQVQQLSDEHQMKSSELENALEELNRTQDRIISQQKLAENMGFVRTGRKKRRQL